MLIAILVIRKIVLQGITKQTISLFSLCSFNHSEVGKKEDREKILFMIVKT